MILSRRPGIGFRRGVDAALKGIALAAAQALRQAPIGPAAGEREAHHGVGGEAIIEAAGKADRARPRNPVTAPRLLRRGFPMRFCYVAAERFAQDVSQESRGLSYGGWNT